MRYTTNIKKVNLDLSFYYILRHNFTILELFRAAQTVVSVVEEKQIIRYYEHDTDQLKTLTEFMSFVKYIVQYDII